MAREFVIGIDTGTSVVKALLADLDGNEVGVAVETTPVETPHTGWSEFDLIEDWNAVARAVRRLLAEHKVDPEKVLAVGVTGKGWGCCFLEKDGMPARKGILWNDSRTVDYLQRWAKDGTLSRAYQISGNYLYTGDCGPVSRWLIDHEPEVAARTEWAVFPPANILYRLTGKIKLCFGDPPSLMDIRQRIYSEEIFDLIGVSSMRSKFLDPSPSTDVAGYVSRAAAEATGLKEGTPVVLGECDVSATATGLGVTAGAEVGIILGTAHVVLVCQADAVLAPETGALAVLLPYVAGTYLMLTGPFIATPNLDWYIGAFGAIDRTEATQAGMSLYDYLDSRLKQLPAGSEGIIYHPYLHSGGERAPIHMPSAKGNFFGLGLQHSRHHLLKSIWEGVAFSALDCLRATQVEPREIYLSGGGSKSPAWCQIEADVMGCPVKVPAGAEHGARGAIITTLVAMGVYADHRAAISKLVTVERTYDPDPKNHAVYSQLFELYRNIRLHLIDDWDHRATIMCSMTDQHS